MMNKQLLNKEWLNKKWLLMLTSAVGVSVLVAVALSHQPTDDSAPLTSNPRAIEQALMESKDPMIEAALRDTQNHGELIRDGQRQYIKGALPPGGQAFLDEVSTLSQELAQARRGAPANNVDDDAMRQLIEEGNALMARVDNEHDLNTREVVEQLMSEPPQYNDPELQALNDKIDALDEDVAELLQSIQ